MLSIKKPDFYLETDLIRERGFALIAGVDEVGRGSLAGPIVASAVIFKNHDKVVNKLSDINDSKLLSHESRERCKIVIQKYALNIGIGEVSAMEIDNIGIGAANILAFDRAIKKIARCDFCLIDGRKFRGFNYPYRCVVRGESQSISIAAASIIAKEYRDSLMIEIGSKIKHYDFSSNKGYASDSHISDLKQHGISPYHRKSFLKFLSDQPKLF